MNTVIYNQYIKDIHRISDLYIDKKKYKKDHECVLEYLFNKIKNPIIVSNILYYLTQISLANYFVAKYQNSIKNKSENLIDNIRDSHIVEIDTKNANIKVSKKFSKVYVSDIFDDFQMDILELVIEHNLETGLLIYEWTHFLDNVENSVQIETKNPKFYAFV